MASDLSLNGTWSLTWTEDAPDYNIGVKLEGCCELTATVPAPIHTILQQQGLLDDPNIGLNSLKARWVEEQYWIYRREFDAPAKALAQNAWISFNRLEYSALILLNGEPLGTHENAHRPAVFNVTGKLRKGRNLLVVRVESGLQATVDRPVGEYAMDPLARITRRPWQRKPQYQCGWDWNPRLMNVGILGDVTLHWCPGPRLDQVAVFAIPNPDLTAATVHARAFLDNPSTEAISGTLIVRIAETGSETRLPITIEPGTSTHEALLTINSPRLWWPIDHGEQALYTVEVSVETAADMQSRTRKTGVRSVAIDQSPHPEEGRYCILTINGRKVFCKGANWVPPDMLYSGVTANRYRELVDLAAQASFNLLRVWGGAHFADPAFCEACDKAGILIWHDFLFACAKFPGDYPEFAAEVRAEVTHAVREMAHHPSLVVWCGNNEVEWGDWAWNYDNTLRTHPHYAIFHHDIPKIVLEEDPSTLHWISSPWSPDYRYPNDPLVGDQHPWGVSIMDGKGADFWQYRQYVDRFPNEGGVLGASSPATLRQFLPEDEQRMLSPSWQHHDNPLAHMAGEQGGLGRAYQTVQIWTGRDPLTMDRGDYTFLSALLQAEGLREYIENYRRRMFSSASAVFWMYNDSWPVTHGWTIVDYYLRKKLAYHPVRRAFQPVTAVVADEGIGRIGVYGVNETQEPWTGRIRYGLFRLAGARGEAEADVTLPPNASARIADIDRSAWERIGLTRAGAFATLERDDTVVAQARLLLARFGELEWGQPAIKTAVDGSTAVYTSDAFVWGACLDIDGESPIADNCFDLLPGIPYRVRLADGAVTAPPVLRTGNAALGH